MRQRYDVLGFGLVVLGSAIFAALGTTDVLFTDKSWLYRWQGLIGVVIALIAAGVAFHNTTRSLQNAEKLEKHRRSRKHAALRAVLPLALARLTDYAARSGQALNELEKMCDDRHLLPLGTMPESIVKTPPDEALKSLTEFIEYSDEVDVGIFESTVALIQIHDSRLHGLLRDDRPEGQGVIRWQIIDAIIDAAKIHAGAAAGFGYARRRRAQLPRTLSWDDVTRALLTMRLGDENRRLHEEVARLAKDCPDPFKTSNTEQRWDVVD
jgi:hypothetical protein